MGLMGWLSRDAAATTVNIDCANELADLKEASEQAAWVMNDEIPRAEATLSKGTSPFHTLGYGACLFWQAILGFDKTLMMRTMAALNQAETSAAEHHRASMRGAAHQKSEIYPSGAAYLLCQAQCQLLSAQLAILSESWTEGLKGINKLRKAYGTLHSLVAAGNKYATTKSVTNTRSSEDSDEFEDAAEEQEASHEDDLHAKAPKHFSQDHPDVSDLRKLTSQEIDLWIHSGVGMLWGMINLTLSLVPPVFRNILAMLNFRGDRAYSIALLWATTNDRRTIFGAIASLSISLYSNIAVGLADDIAVEGAYPEASLRHLMATMRAAYPDSQLWQIENARITVVTRNLEQAAQDLDFEPVHQFDQLSGLRMFERSLNLMFLHRFEECATSFLETIKLLAWSHGTCYYIAAACHIELYRDLKESDPAAAKKHADLARQYLEPVPALAKKRFLLGQQLPFDVFVGTKLSKWQARAKARNCDILDCVGISPIEEMAYFWTGYRRMSSEHLETSLARLARCEESPEWQQSETIDEKAGLALLQGIALRFLGRYGEAKMKIRDGVLCYTPQQIKNCPFPVTYPLPVAHYELAVCLWREAGGVEASREDLRRISEEVEVCARWERYGLEERMVAKIAGARDTIDGLLLGAK